MNLLTAPRRHQTGFTLTELAVVVTISAVLLAIAVPSLRAMSRGTELRSTARTLSNDIQRVRSFAVAGQQDFAGWTATQRTRQAGIRFVNATQYALFVDNDTESNGAASEVIVQIKTLADKMQMQCSSPEIRFERNGTLASGTVDQQITLTDSEYGTSATIRVFYGGKTEIGL